MSLDPIEAIEQVLDRIDEGCNYGNNWCTGGWLHNASKEEIIRFISVNLRARVQNALERTNEKIDSLRKENEKAIKLFEALSNFVAWYEEKTDDLDGIAEHAIKVLEDSTSVGCDLINENVRMQTATEVKRNCDRFNTGDVKMDAQHAMEAILKEGVAGYRGIAEYLLSPVKEEEPCTRATDATI